MKIFLKYVFRGYSEVINNLYFGKYVSQMGAYAKSRNCNTK